MSESKILAITARVAALLPSFAAADAQTVVAALTRTVTHSSIKQLGTNVSSAVTAALVSAAETVPGTSESPELLQRMLKGANAAITALQLEASQTQSAFGSFAGNLVVESVNVQTTASGVSTLMTSLTSTFISEVLTAGLPSEMFTGAMNALNAALASAKLKTAAVSADDFASTLGAGIVAATVGSADKLPSTLVSTFVNQISVGMLKVAAPTFSVAAGGYGPAESVTLATTTSDATIYYTVDGTTPTTASTLYSVAIAVSSTKTIKAYGVKMNYTDSSVASALYAINGAVAAPTFSVAAGAYNLLQSVTLASATPAAAIYYTLDGSTPTESSPLYSEAISVALSKTIKAMAVKAKFLDSGVASASYVIDTVNPAFTSTAFTTPASPNWIVSPAVTLSVSEAATVTLYSNSICTTAISTATAVTSSAGQSVTVTSITLASTTTIYGKAVDAAGNTSTCTNLTAYTQVMKFKDPDPSAANGFGSTIVELTNGNIVITSPQADMNGVVDSGAVYLFNGVTGALISTLSGSTASDNVGLGVTALTNGNFVVKSHNWDCTAALCPSPAIAAVVANVGAVTWGSGTLGVSGPVSSLNSLVGSTLTDQVGASGVIALSNGNYVVGSSTWDCTIALCPSPAIAAVVANVGAATWGSGTTGISGPVSSLNSLVGWTASDQVGLAVYALTNGNYVLTSNRWDCSATGVTAGLCSSAAVDIGAVTWGDGAATGTRLVGPVSSTNSLVGSTASDQVGVAVYALTNGNYVVLSAQWDAGAVTDVGAVTWGDGATTGTRLVGAVSIANSLVGSTAIDSVGNCGVTALTNGNYVVKSCNWDGTAVVDVGAVTWGNGATGTFGAVSGANSLVGSTASDSVGNGGVTALTNGNYVVTSVNWDCTAALCLSPAIAAVVSNVGAVTWGNGATTGNRLVGAVSSANSLVGSTASDNLGNFGIAGLTNGNYVVSSSSWDCSATLVTAGLCSSAATNVGAVTWGNGATGTFGPVSSANSLVGSTASDGVGNGLATALTNGNYVVASQNWDAGAVANVGAVTWGNGATGTFGPVSSANSLVGSTASDFVGINGYITALTNGNYVVVSSSWTANVGAVTWGNGATGTFGPVSSANSLVGSTTGDFLGNVRITALTNGNYVFSTSSWDCTLTTGCPGGAKADVGAVTWGSGTTGVSGPVTASNSLIGGLVGDQIGGYPTIALSNGNVMFRNSQWGLFDPGLIIEISGTAMPTGILTE